ncbi:MAG TPA: hypothetical protein VFQ61_20580 [Polyangiaceae bacterium]|nr:hypothetical protein [Polyangiaceae bacterium]
MKHETSEDVWLKDRSIDSPWDYDVRLFLEPAFILVEVSVTTASLRQDVAQLLGWLRAQTVVEFTDDDGVPLTL